MVAVLTKDVWYEVFKYLDAGSLTKCSQVCRDFNEKAIQDYFWRILLAEKNMIPSELTLHNISNLTGVKDLFTEIYKKIKSCDTVLRKACNFVEKVDFDQNALFIYRLNDGGEDIRIEIMQSNSNEYDVYEKDSIEELYVGKDQKIVPVSKYETENQLRSFIGLSESRSISYHAVDSLMTTFRFFWTLSLDRVKAYPIIKYSYPRCFDEINLHKQIDKILKDKFIHLRELHESRRNIKDLTGLCVIALSAFII